MVVTLKVGLIVGFVYLFISIVGSFANGLVIMTYLRWSTLLLKQPKDVLIISLAIGDFVMCSVICPLGFVAAFAFEWIWGISGCMFYGFFATWVGLANILQLMCHALERYMTLSSSTPNAVSLKNSFQMIMLSWFLSFIASCLPLIGWSRYTYEGFGLHCSIPWNSGLLLDSSYASFLLFFFFIVPVFIIAYSYIRVFFVVRRLYLNADTRWGRNAHETLQTYGAQVRSSKQLLMMIAGYLFAWTPYAVMSAMVTFTGVEFATEYHEYPAIFAKFASIYNPLLYFFSYQSLRVKAGEILRCRVNTNVVQPLNINIPSRELPQCYT